MSKYLTVTLFGLCLASSAFSAPLNIVQCRVAARNGVFDIMIAADQGGFILTERHHGSVQTVTTLPSCQDYSQSGFYFVSMGEHTLTLKKETKGLHGSYKSPRANQPYATGDCVAHPEFAKILACVAPSTIRR